MSAFARADVGHGLSRIVNLAVPAAGEAFGFARAIAGRAPDPRRRTAPGNRHELCSVIRTKSQMHANPRQPPAWEQRGAPSEWPISRSFAVD